MAKGAKKRRANRKKREMGLRVQTSASGNDDFLPPEEHGDDVFYPKTPVQASEVDEKDRISEAEVGSSASQTDEAAFSQGLASRNDTAENLGFHEFDASQKDAATGLERLGCVESHEFSRGFPLSSSEAARKWEGLVESNESSEGFPLSSSEAIMKWISLGKLECAISDGHEALKIPEEKNEVGNDAALGYSEEGDDETQIPSKEETVVGHGALHAPEEHNGCVSGTVLGCSLQPGVVPGIQSKEENLDGHGTLHIPEEQNRIERVAVLGCSDQNYVETCMHCKGEPAGSVTNEAPFSSTLEEMLSCDVLTVFSDPERNAVEASGISKDETLEDVRNRGIGEGVMNGNPFSSTAGEKPSLEVSAIVHDSQLGPVEESDISRDEIVEDVRNGESYFEQDHIEIGIRCKGETLEDVKTRDPMAGFMNGNSSLALGGQPFLEMLAVFNDSKIDVAGASDTPEGELLGNAKSRDSYFEQDFVETCSQNKQDPVEDVKGSSYFSSIFQEKPSLEVLAVLNDFKLDAIGASDVPKDEIVEDVKNAEFYIEQDTVQTCVQCKEGTVEDVKKEDHVEGIMNESSSALGEQPSLEMLAVFNDSDLDVAEASDRPKGEVVWGVKNRGSFFEQDYVETCIQNQEGCVEDVKGSNLFSSIFGGKPSFEVLAVFNDAKLDAVEASNVSKDEIVGDVKNNESCFEEDCTWSCIQRNEEIVEGLNSGDPMEDVRNENPVSSTSGEKPSLETLVAFKNFELDVVEASNAPRDNIVDVAKNNKIHFEQDYIGTCIQCKEGTLEDDKTKGHVKDATANGKIISFELGGNPSLEVLAVSNDAEHAFVEVGNISKDVVVGEIKTRESCFERDYVKTCIQCKEETVKDGKDRGSVEDLQNGNPSSSALEESPSLAVLAAVNNSKSDLAESTNTSKDEIAKDVSLEELVSAAVDNSEQLNAVEAGNGSRDEIVQDVKPMLVEKPYLEALPTSDNSQPDVELCSQSKYGSARDVEAGDGVCSTMAHKPALEVQGLPLPAGESSPQKAEPLLANDFEPVDASAGILQDVQTIKKEKLEGEIDMEFSNHFQHIDSGKITEEDKSAHVERPSSKDPYEGDKRTLLNEDPHVEDDNRLYLPPLESPSLWKRIRRVLDCWLWIWS